MMKSTKMILFLLAVISATLFFSGTASAQVGFLPEFMGNAAGVDRPGFCLKFFPSYYYQHSIAAHDAEAAFEPQYFIPGFTGDIHKDQFQFAVHVPVGYRRQKDVAGSVESVTGIGTITTTIEYYWRMIDTEDLDFWFDNGITVGYPTATDNKGISFAGNPYSMRIGGNAFTFGWYQESMIRYKKFLLSIMPIGMTWGFHDRETDTRGGLSLSIMNASAGYAINDYISLGVNFGLLLGNVAGSQDVLKNSVPVSVRFYTGPAALISFLKDYAMQVGVIIDTYTKDVPRGQGIAIALWHHF